MQCHACGVLVLQYALAMSPLDRYGAPLGATQSGTEWPTGPEGATAREGGGISRSFMTLAFNKHLHF